jgi:hypothetical protein
MVFLQIITQKKNAEKLREFPAKTFRIAMKTLQGQPVGKTASSKPRRGVVMSSASQPRRRPDGNEFLRAN